MQTTTFRPSQWQAQTPLRNKQMPSWIKSFVTTSLALTLGVSFAAADKSAPNIVILYADDMGYGDLGANNPESKIPTPHLDKLASEGMRFTDGHSSSAICTPSRYALLTGRYHWRKFHGIVQSFGKPSFDEEELTMPELLKTKGYRTACIGKWHLGWNWDDIKNPDGKPAEGTAKRNPVYPPNAFDWSKPISGGPLSHGFDYYFGDDVPNFPPYAWFENDRVITEPTVALKITPETKEGHWEARKGPMAADWDFYQVVPKLGERAASWVAEQKGKDGPFFLYVPFNSPHAPIVPNDEFIGKSKANGYGDFVYQTDHIVGGILKAIDDNGFADNTIVIFTADNGAEAYCLERIQKVNHESSKQFRGMKRDIYEGGHRVPFLVRWPGKVKAGSVNDGIISQVDLMATLAAATGTVVPKDTAHDSFNQLPTMLGKKPSPRTKIVHNTFKDAYAVRDGDWLLVARKGVRGQHAGAHRKVPAWYDEKYGYTMSETAGELFNMAKDPSQKHNLYQEKPEKVKELTALLAKIRAKGQVR
jgi:arylsulfatase A